MRAGGAVDERGGAGLLSPAPWAGIFSNMLWKENQGVRWRESPSANATVKILLTLLILLLPVAGYGEDFTLAIAVPMKDGARTVYLSSGSNRISFHVVLTNTSEKEQRIWEAWNSWGYNNLSLEWTGTDGKAVKVERGPQEWDKNFPSFLTLKPGEPHIFDVWFPDNWRNIPSAVKDGEEVTLRAVFAIAADKDSAKAGVWSGTVRSPEVALRLRRLQ